MASESLYERLGGQPAVLLAVKIFYDKVLADENTRGFFSDLDMEQQVKKQVAFMTRVFGGPPEYAGRNLRDAHRDLVQRRGLGDSHFDAIAKHLQSTLEELGIAPELVQETMSIVASTRKDVLNR